MCFQPSVLFAVPNDRSLLLSLSVSSAVMAGGGGCDQFTLLQG